MILKPDIIVLTNHMCKAFLFTALLLVAQITQATCTSTGVGDWTDSGSWTCDVVSTPGCCDTVIIESTDDIEVNTQVDLTGCGPIHVIVRGILRFKTGKKLLLPAGSTVDVKSGGQLVPGGGGGNSNYIEVGGNTVWSASDGTVSGEAYYTGAGLLPIELLEFNALCVNGRVQINWSTATEENNAYFQIERSKDGINFEPILTITGAGNSTSLIEYFETDFNPLKGISYYRLSQTDYDGATEKFNIVPVRCLDPKEPAISLFPNPVSADSRQINLLLEGFEGQEVLVMLRDITGSQYYSKVEIVKSGSELKALALDAGIPAGNYIVTASSNNSIYSKILVIVEGRNSKSGG